MGLFRNSSVFSIVIAVGLAIGPGNAATTPKPPVTPITQGLDQKRIHDMYNEGDFDPVLEMLDQFQKQNPRYNHSDSIFIAKHLAVIYTANPATREKGKYYMMRLLELLPSAKLVDMFVSDEVDRIFEKMKEEYAVRARAFGRETEVAVPTSPKQDTLPARPGPEAPRSSWVQPTLWVVGGVALAAAGGLTYYMNSPDPKKSPPKEIVVPNHSE